MGCAVANNDGHKIGDLKLEPWRKKSVERTRINGDSQEDFSGMSDSGEVILFFSVVISPETRDLGVFSLSAIREEVTG